MKTKASIIILLSISIIHYSFAMKKEVYDLESFKEQIRNCSSDQEKIKLAQKRIKQYTKKIKKYKKMKKKVKKKEKTIEALRKMIEKNISSDFYNRDEFHEEKMREKEDAKEEIDLVDSSKKEIEEVNSEQKLDTEEKEITYEESLDRMSQELQEFKNKLNQVKSEKKLLKIITVEAHKVKEEIGSEVKKKPGLCCWWSRPGSNR